MDLSNIALFFLLIFLSGFFSGSETALTTLSAGKVRTLVEQKKYSAKFIKSLKDQPNKMLITILIGNNIVNIWASVMASSIALSEFGEQSLATVVGIMTFLILVFGEIVPKTLAQRFNILGAQICSPVLYVLKLILYPVIFLLERLTRVIIYVLGKEKFKTVTEDEVIAMLNIGHEEGEFNKQENEFIRNIFEFSDTTAEEIMINRNEIEAFPESITVEKALKILNKSSHSRVPVFENTIDNVIGYITHKMLSKFASNKRTAKKKLSDLKLAVPLYFPVTKPINEIFRAFQKKRVHIAIILDEFGATSGILTLEDVLEEIVGEIVDETDQVETGIKKIGKTSLQMDGNVTIEEVTEFIPFESDVAPHRTVAYLIIKKLGAFPREGEKVILPDSEIEFIVEKMIGKTIQRVRMNLKRKA
ncbi:MAG: hemolysin family protein [Candidatus Gracilibacteria bacterium]|nr:hemolysin family protein [Candidatus Gracilibacteria bacterium]